MFVEPGGIIRFHNLPGRKGDFFLGMANMGGEPEDNRHLLLSGKLGRFQVITVGLGRRRRFQHGSVAHAGEMLSVRGHAELSHYVEAERQILQVLEHDGYLEQGKDGFIFVSKLVRDWWKKRYDAFYTPVNEREV